MNSVTAWINKVPVIVLLTAAFVFYHNAAAEERNYDFQQGPASRTEAADLAGDPDLETEYRLWLEHEKAVREMHAAEKYQVRRMLQPVNKSSACAVPADFFDPALLKRRYVLLFWEGDCYENRAAGFGRAYLVSEDKPVFETLLHLRPELPTQSNAYYYKNTAIPERTEFFYGMLNRHRASGILIRYESIPDSLRLSMIYNDTDHLISYRKETSQKTPYVMNILSTVTMSKVFYDMRNTNMESVALGSHLSTPTGRRIGYSLLIDKEGRLTVRDAAANKSIKPKQAYIKRDMQIVREIEDNIESSVRNLNESMAIIKLYEEQTCKRDTFFEHCDKLNCRSFCDTENGRISPKSQEIRKMLTFLVLQHNAAAMRSLLEETFFRIFDEKSDLAETHEDAQHIIDTDTGLSPYVADRYYAEDKERRERSAKEERNRQENLSGSLSIEAENLTPEDSPEKRAIENYRREKARTTDPIFNSVGQ